MMPPPASMELSEDKNNSYHSKACFLCLLPQQSLNYQYTYSMNALLLALPIWLCFDWSMGCVPLIISFTDPRLLVLPALWVCFVMLLRRGMSQGRGSHTSRYA